MKKSWELGVTQSWNKIDPSEEAKIDEAAMGGEQEEEEDVGAKKKERMVQDVVTTGKSATDIAVLALTGTTSERAIQMAEQSRSGRARLAPAARAAARPPPACPTSLYPSRRREWATRFTTPASARKPTPEGGKGAAGLTPAPTPPLQKLEKGEGVST